MTELMTTITAATVYPELVRINTRGSVKLNKGTHTLEILKLPLIINPDSLRASIYGAGNPRLLSARVKRDIFPELPSDPARNLESEIENMQDELKRLDARIELIKQNRLILDWVLGLNICEFGVAGLIGHGMGLLFEGSECEVLLVARSPFTLLCVQVKKSEPGTITSSRSTDRRTLIKATLTPYLAIDAISPYMADHPRLPPRDVSRFLRLYQDRPRSLCQREITLLSWSYGWTLAEEEAPLP